MTLPHFIIIGAQKAGTTWLARRLQEHPQIFIPKNLELHFFDVKKNYDKGLRWYERHFDSAKSNQIIGEKTPDYLWVNRGKTFHNNIPDRIFSDLGGLKLLVVLRDPVSRALSALNHQMSKGRLSPYSNVQSILFGDNSAIGRQFGIIERGFYAQQLEAFWKVHSSENTHILIYEEDIMRKSDLALLGVWEFLGVDQAFKSRGGKKIDNSRMNSRWGLAMNYYFPKINPITSKIDRLLPKQGPVGATDEIVQKLQDLYASSNMELESLIGRKLDYWGATQNN